MEKFKNTVISAAKIIKDIIKNIFTKPLLSISLLSLYVVICYISGIVFCEKIYALYALFIFIISITGNIKE